MTDTEKAALERRIDELCAEVEYARQTSRSRLERIDQLKDENAKLRKMNEAMWLIIRCAIGEVSARDGLPVIHEDDLTMLRNMRRDLRNEVDE